MASASGGSSSRSNRFVSVSQAKRILAENGIDSARACVRERLEAHTRGDTIDIMEVLATDGEGVLAKALTGHLAMPNWSEFTSTVKGIYKSIRSEGHGGECASYIPILAEADPGTFSVSICTVDGQEYSIGDTDAFFSIQSCVKPLMYAVAVEDRGLKKVHRHVGFEPSGLAFNEVSLNAFGLPHNPMVNAGAISTGSLVGPGLDNAAKFRYFMKRLTEFSGGQKIGFSHATYLCEHETAWRNNALVAYMTDAGVFPRDCVPSAALDFYLQCCSIEVNSKIAAGISSTLANGGVCPLTGQKVINPVTTKSTLTLMFSCGMYDYSGTFMSEVGLPAKSGVAGLVYLVIPHCMGIAVFSPPLDSHGNSVRGIEFCKRLLKAYPFGIFKQIVQGRASAPLLDGPSTKRGKHEHTPGGRNSARGAAPAAATSAASVSTKRTQVGTLPPIRDGDDETVSVASSEQGSASKGTGKVASFRVTTASATNVTQTATDTSDGHRLDTIHKVLTRLRRFVRVIRMIRVWCGLPIDAADVETLKAVAARDAGDAPEPLKRLLARTSSTTRHLPVLTASSEVQFALYSEYRAHVTTHDEDEELTPLAPALRQASSDGALSAQDAAVAAVEAEDAELLPTSSLIPLSALKMYIERQGINTSEDNPVMFNLLKRMVDNSKLKHSLHPLDMMLPGQHRNLVVRALLSELAMPNFGSFVSELLNIYEAVKRNEQSGEVFHGLAIEEIASADAEAFGVSVVTVDGQMANIGDTGKEVPLFGTVRPLLYALACKDVGVSEVHRWVMEEPTAADPSTFSLMPAAASGHGGGGGKKHEDAEKAEKAKAAAEAAARAEADAARGLMTPELDRAPHPRPANPFLDSGALAVASLVGRAHYPAERRLFHDNGSRFSHMMSEFSRWCGGRRVGFNNSVFLAQKQKRLKTLAISYYLKGMSVYPAVTDPTEAAHYLFQAEAVEMSTSNLAVVAATLANIGVCPLTQESCIDADVMRSTLSLMYNSGLNNFTGRWMFTVGIPSSTGLSGLTLVIVPGIMGIAIYSPRVNAAFVSPRALMFCEMLTARYRVNIFDQLVYADADVEISQKQRATAAISMEQSLMQFELCTAAGRGDIPKLQMLLSDGADPNSADYDMRTALHIACSDGQEQAVRILVEAGAQILVKDRWQCTPYDDAVRRGYHTIVALLDEALAAIGVRIPASAGGATHRRAMTAAVSTASLADGGVASTPSAAHDLKRQVSSPAMPHKSRSSATPADPAPPGTNARVGQSPATTGSTTLPGDGDIGLSMDPYESLSQNGSAVRPLTAARTGSVRPPPLPMTK